MTTSELLQKRVIVEHTYPGCKFQIGDILTEMNSVYQCRGKMCDNSLPFIRIDKHEVEESIVLGANNFRVLQWWEFRLGYVETLRYLKSIGGSYVIKTRVVGEYPWELHEEEYKLFVRYISGEDKGIMEVNEFLIPATEEEYNKFIKSKQ